MGLTEGRPQPNYTCSQAELYAALELVWKSFAKYETDFTTDNTTYTTGMADGKIDDITAANELPDGQQRNAGIEVLSNALSAKADTALGKWNTLESYIAKAFTGADYKPRVEEAGKLYYRKASKKNWEDVKELMTKGNTFIGNHTSELTTDGGMPTGFDTAFGTAKTDFEGTYDDFMDARETAQEETDAKINANNAIYKDGQDMMKDGKRIFKKNAVVRKRFTWSRVLQLVTPDGATKHIFELNLAAGQQGNFDFTGDPFDAEKVTSIKFAAVGSQGKFFVSNSPTGAPGSLFYLIDAGNSISKSAADAATDLGINETNIYFNVLNSGTTTGHYTITFTVSK